MLQHEPRQNPASSPPLGHRWQGNDAKTRALGIFTLCALPLSAVAQDDWSQRKCDLYQQAFADAVTAQGAVGLRPEFLNQNAGFIASGCLTQGTVCARTAEEIALANLLTVMTMNEGMASTFVPFACPD
ncbi:hypothetical protein G5B38_03280 [Pseudohalocynthiibacter aestuariivivens]|nr:hypothetical protein [Pseudohalocynthiibacter aestuariivivens]QIE44631.1 hypothetical protein G5B38_03280 [Pseudohalocynthiibacter aestuariivivens]